MRYLAAIAALLCATLAVFWFNQSPAFRPTVKEEGEVQKQPVIQDEPNAPSQNIQPPTGNETPETPSEVTPPSAWQVFLDGLLVDKTGYEAAVRFDETTRLSAKKLDLTGEWQMEWIQSALYAYAANGELYLEVQTTKSPCYYLYGAHLLYRSEQKTYLLDAQSGQTLLDVTEYLPVYCKTKDQQPIFTKEGGYYVYENGAMVAIDAPTFRGLYYNDAPLPSAVLTPFYDKESGLWGYQNASGDVVISPTYRRAYPFGDNGLAAVQKTKTTGLWFIDQSGNVVLNSAENTYTYNGLPAYDLYAAVEDLSEQSMGELFFSHGYVRVVAMTYAINNTTEVLRTRVLLVDGSGREMSLPTDYTVRAYSDGVAVLEKNGKYGYYSHKGYWIVDPIYESAAAFSGGVGVLVDQNGKYLAVNLEGRVIIDAIFDALSAPSAGNLLGYQKEQGWMLLSFWSKSE